MRGAQRSRLIQRHSYARLIDAPARGDLGGRGGARRVEDLADERAGADVFAADAAVDRSGGRPQRGDVCTGQGRRSSPASRAQVLAVLDGGERVANAGRRSAARRLDQHVELRRAHEGVGVVGDARRDRWRRPRRASARRSCSVGQPTRLRASRARDTSRSAANNVVCERSRRCRRRPRRRPRQEHRSKLAGSDDSDADRLADALPQQVKQVHLQSRVPE